MSVEKASPRVICDCPPCPGRGHDGHGTTHCAECCFGTLVEADLDCPVHGDGLVNPPASTDGATVADIHWGHVDSRPTSLHGNGAAAFEHTTLDPAKVTCRLCVHQLVNSEALAWVDRHGDVWRMGDDGLMWTPETAPFSREHVEKKWGPLRLVDTRFPPASTEAGERA